MNAGTDNTKKNIQSIDDRIDSGYAPKFRSPSGRILGMPNLDGSQNNTSSFQDTPAKKPSF
jgi:hypothetical protein